MEFPNFLFGTFSEVQGRATRLGKAWAKAYEGTGRFPEAKAGPIAPGDLVVTLHVNDLDRGTPRWRLYGVGLLRSAIYEAMQWRDSERVAHAFEQQTRSTPWGALSACLGHVAPNSIEVETARVRALLAVWEPLSELRYVPAGVVRVTNLDVVIEQTYEGLLATWCKTPGGDLRKRLDHAADTMTAATPEQVRAAVVGRMSEVARADPRLMAKPELADPSHLAALLRTIDQRAITDMEAGYTSAIRGALYDLLRRPGP